MRLLRNVPRRPGLVRGGRGGAHGGGGFGGGVFGHAGRILQGDNSIDTLDLRSFLGQLVAMSAKNLGFEADAEPPKSSNSRNLTGRVPIDDQAQELFWIQMLAGLF